MTNQLPRHSGAPFDPWLSTLDFGTCSGLELPFDGQVLNKQDGLQLRVTTPPFIAYNNTEIDPRLHDERHRWPVDGPAWMLPMSCDAAYSFACKKYPSLGVQRGALYDLFLEDADLLQRERRNYSHGNAFRLITTKMVNDSGSMEDALFALHPSGPFLNVLQLSLVANNLTASSPKCELLAQSAVDISSTILDISPPTRHYNRCDRLIALTTTSQFVFFVRLRTEACRNPQIELLHRVSVGAQPFPTICNPLIMHECSLISDDGNITIYDASTCTESFAGVVDASESAWLRQAYTAHPRILHVASRRKLRRLDLRTGTFMNDVGDSLVYHHDPSVVITAFSNDLQDPFSFVIANWDHLSLFDERYTARPVIRWQHHRPKRPIAHIEISTHNKNCKTMATFSHDSSQIDVYRYSQADDGSTTSLSSPQQIDIIRDAQLRGIAFHSLSDISRCYRLTELGTVFYSEYGLADDTINYGEPCPSFASHDPLALLSRSSLTPYEFIDFTKPIQEIIELNRSTGDDKTPMLGEKELAEFMAEHHEQIMEYISEWRLFSELYRYLRSELTMPAVSRSLDVYNAVNDIAERFCWASRLIPGMSDQEANSTQQPRIAPRDFSPLCTCSLNSVSDCQPSPDCLYPDLCQALLRSAICMKNQILSLDLESTWVQSKSNYLRTGRNSKKSVDLSTDLDALLSLLNSSANDEAPEEIQVVKAPADVEDEFSVVEIFESLKQSWEDLTQSDMTNDEIR